MITISQEFLNRLANESEHRQESRNALADRLNHNAIVDALRDELDGDLDE